MRRLAAVLALGLAVGLGFWAAASPPHLQGKHPSAGVHELLAFEAQLIPIVRAGGQVVEQSMKPALTDLQHDHVTPPSFMATEASGWVSALSKARTDVLSIRTRPELAAVTASMAEALREYVDAARLFRSAMLSDGPTQARLLASGLARARAADATYDRASARLQSIRQRLGLGASPYFPGGADG